MRDNKMAPGQPKCGYRKINTTRTAWTAKALGPTTGPSAERLEGAARIDEGGGDSES